MRSAWHSGRSAEPSSLGRRRSGPVDRHAGTRPPICAMAGQPRHAGHPAAADRGAEVARSRQARAGGDRGKVPAQRSQVKHRRLGPPQPTAQVTGAHRGQLEPSATNPDTSGDQAKSRTRARCTSPARRRSPARGAGASTGATALTGPIAGAVHQLDRVIGQPAGPHGSFPGLAADRLPGILDRVPGSGSCNCSTSMTGSRPICSR